MKWNKRENLGQTIRNYENNVNISYFFFVLIDYLYILVMIVDYNIRK